MRKSAQRKGDLRVLRTGAVEPEPHPGLRARTIVLLSGKGGVGKTTIATNLALGFQERGRRVLLVDGDWGMANVDLLLGVHPRSTLHEVILGERSPKEILLTTPEGLQVLPGASGVEEMANLDEVRSERLLRRLVEIEGDRELILLDAPSGIGRPTIQIARAADEILLVTTPEPAAIADAYACLRVLCRRRLRGRIRLVVNQARSAVEARATAERIQDAARRFLSFEPDYLGAVLDDAAVPSAARMQQPLLRIFPRTAAAQCVHRLCGRLLLDHEPEPKALAPEETDQVVNLDGRPA